jgi:hypothetical protein
MSAVITFGKSSGNKSKSTKSRAARQSQAGKPLASSSFDADRLFQDFFGDSHRSLGLSDRVDMSKSSSIPGPGDLVVASGGAAEKYKGQFPDSRNKSGLLKSPDGRSAGYFRNGKIISYSHSPIPLDPSFEQIESGYVGRSKGSRKGSSTVILNGSGTPSATVVSRSDLSLPETPLQGQSHVITDQGDRNYEKNISIFPRKSQKVPTGYRPPLKGSSTLEEGESTGSKRFDNSPSVTGFRRESPNKSSGDPTPETASYERFTPFNLNKTDHSSLASAFYAIMNEQSSPIEKLEKLKKLMEMMKMMQKLHTP